MKTEPVQSKSITHVGYDAASKTMRVTFNHGASYDYSGVHESDYKAMIGAGSIGQHFASHIKGKFDHSKV